MQERVERAGIDRLQGLLTIQEALRDRVDREPHGGLRGTLGVPGLEHP